MGAAGAAWASGSDSLGRRLPGEWARGLGPRAPATPGSAGTVGPRDQLGARAATARCHEPLTLWVTVGPSLEAVGGRGSWRGLDAASSRVCYRSLFACWVDAGRQLLWARGVALNEPAHPQVQPGGNATFLVWPPEPCTRHRARLRKGGVPEPAPHPAAAPHLGAPGAVRPCHPHGPHPGGPAVCAPAAHRPVPLGAFPPPVPELSPPRPSAPAMPLCPRGSPQLSAAPRPSPAALTAQPPAGGPCPAHRTQGDTALRQGRGRP